MTHKLIQLKNFVLAESNSLRYYALLYWCQTFSKQAYMRQRSKYYENLWKF
jgi:hypothetical protein